MLLSVKSPFIGRVDSVALAPEMSPMSIRFSSFQPNVFNRRMTSDLTSESFPQIKFTCFPSPIIFGFTINPHHIVFQVFTTLTTGKVFCISSLRELVLFSPGRRLGGIPLLKSSGFEISIRIFPARYFSPA